MRFNRFSCILCSVRGDLLIRDLLLVIIVFAPILTQNYSILWISTLSMIYSLLVISWLFMERQSGWTSFAHSIPFGLAAYLLAIYPYAVFIAPLASTALFLTISKLDRVKFVFVTFVLTVVFWLSSFYMVIERNGISIGGEEGFSVLSLYLSESYIFAVLLLISSYVFVRVLEKSSIGLKMAAMRDDEEAARAIGINVFKYRFMNFVISCSIASLSGICYALFFGHVSPDVFSIEVALFPFIATFIAGRAWISAVVGSYILVIVSRVFSGFVPDFHLLIYAIVLIASPKLRRWWGVKC